MTKTYKAMQVSFSNNAYNAAIITLPIPIIKPGEVLIKIIYSSLNYKDCLSISGHRGITRNYPHIPGVDLAGIVVQSLDKRFLEGDEVIATGYDIGMNHAGGFAEYIALDAKWVLSKPNNLTLRQSMLFGTAGFAAALSIYYIKEYINNFTDKKILVTGAKGGVGLISLLMLHDLVDNLVIISRGNDIEFFRKIGLKNFSFTDFSGDKQKDKPLMDKNFDIVIDNLGGKYLQLILKQMNYNGIICACGNIAGNNLDINVFPFILRGVRIQGISSANASMSIRKKIWYNIAEFNNWSNLENAIEEISLAEIYSKSKLILAGKNSGRYIVKLDA
jgi:acrylyl-CoA reductase (NADPH)